MRSLKPKNSKALVAIDLGAESCRVSLLRWTDEKPVVQMVHRFANTAVQSAQGLRWNLDLFCSEIERALRQCGELASEGIASISVDGWSVDYVRLDAQGKPLLQPFCYRDERTVPIEIEVHQHLKRERLYALTGTSQLRINTLYQLLADAKAGVPADAPWVMLPEYILYWLGGEKVGEWTNATHTSLVQLDRADWCEEIFDELGLSLAAAPKIVHAGTVVGKVGRPLAQLPAFAETQLIVGACHDTASAVAGIPATGNDWAYISSGTWSLVGTVLEKASNTPEAFTAEFTNIGAVGGICFHTLINGLWLLRQSMEPWASEGQKWDVVDLIKAAEIATPASGNIDVDDPDLLLPGNMPERINAQREKSGLSAITSAPVMARLIFQSLADRYAEVLKNITQITGKKFARLYIVGGGSQNQLLNQMTAQATGLEVLCGAVESSTVGNFAIQLAVNEGPITHDGVQPAAVAKWATVLL